MGAELRFPRGRVREVAGTEPSDGRFMGQKPDLATNGYSPFGVPHAGAIGKGRTGCDDLELPTQPDLHLHAPLRHESATELLRPNARLRSHPITSPVGSRWTRRRDGATTPRGIRR